MKHILIAVSGMTPQIITETVWALTQTRLINLSEIHVITTLKGQDRVMNDLLKPETGQFWKLCSDYDIDPTTIRFDEGTIHIIVDREGHELDDIRNSEDNEAARDLIFGVIEDLTRDADTCLHGSLAGGRKSMGFLLGAAFAFLGRAQDLLYHILVTPDAAENHLEFFFTPARDERVLVGRNGTSFSTGDVRIDLVELPFVSVREFVKFDTQNYRLLQKRTQDEIKAVRVENVRLQKVAGNVGGLLGQSMVMRRVKQSIEQVADADGATVLILGETGTGKELVARAIHNLSVRKDKPFVPINCGAIPKEMIEAELFGALAGAYTGQISVRKGAFRQAQDGTIFLDEMGELSPQAQQALLRVLQEKKVKPLGSDEEEAVSMRIIAATNRDLRKMVESGEFREDLFQRLNMWPIEMPPLRARKEDIPGLADHFLDIYNNMYNKQVLGFSAEAISALQAYFWPGNVRQLANLVEKLVIGSHGAVRIRVEEINTELPTLPKTELPVEYWLDLPLSEGVGAFEKIRIMHALEVSEGVKKRAAESLGITRPTLDGKIEDFGLASWLDQMRF